MKRWRIWRRSILVMLLAAFMLASVGCGSKNDPGKSQNDASGQTTAESTAGGNTEKSSAAESTKAAERAEDSMEDAKDDVTGAARGVMDDVKQGVDDLMGEGSSAAQTTAAGR